MFIKAVFTMMLLCISSGILGAAAPVPIADKITPEGVLYVLDKSGLQSALIEAEKVIKAKGYEGLQALQRSVLLMPQEKQRQEVKHFLNWLTFKMREIKSEEAKSRRAPVADNVQQENSLASMTAGLVVPELGENIVYKLAKNWIETNPEITKAEALAWYRQSGRPFALDVLKRAYALLQAERLKYIFFRNMSDHDIDIRIGLDQDMVNAYPERTLGQPWAEPWPEAAEAQTLTIPARVIVVIPWNSALGHSAYMRVYHSQRVVSMVDVERNPEAFPVNNVRPGSVVYINGDCSVGHIQFPQ